MGGAQRAYRGEKTCTQSFGGEPEGERPLGRPRRKCKDNIKRDLQDVGWVGMDWIDLAQNSGKWWALVNAVMKLQFS